MSGTDELKCYGRRSARTSLELIEQSLECKATTGKEPSKANTASRSLAD